MLSGRILRLGLRLICIRWIISSTSMQLWFDNPFISVVLPQHIVPTTHIRLFLCLFNMFFREVNTSFSIHRISPFIFQVNLSNHSSFAYRAAVDRRCWHNAPLNDNSTKSIYTILRPCQGDGGLTTALS